MSAGETMKREPEGGALVRVVREWAFRASTEVCVHDEELLFELAERLPVGASVYVAHTPRATVEDVTRVAMRAQRAGFRASPHIVVRRLASHVELQRMLERLREAGIRQVLLVAGDIQRPVGPFTSTLEVLDCGLLERCGIEQVGVAGHPEGHRLIAPEVHLAALRRKQAFAERTGVAVHIVTQFGFDPERVYAWSRRLHDEGISLPIHVGIAGPTPLPKLLKFAVRCGIGASVRAVGNDVSGMLAMARKAKSGGEVLLGLLRTLAQDGEKARLAQVHVFSFGGALATADWLRAIVEGNFAVQSDGRGLEIRTSGSKSETGTDDVDAG